MLPKIRGFSTIDTAPWGQRMQFVGRKNMLILAKGKLRENKTAKLLVLLENGVA